MLRAIVEKLTFGLAAFVVYAPGRVAGAVLGGAPIDTDQAASGFSHFRPGNFAKSPSVE
jgi:hypothetical protein